MIALVFCNGFFAAAEIALISVNHARVKKKAEEGDKRAVLLKSTIESPNKFLASIQIGISLLGLFSGAFGASAIAPSIIDLFKRTGVLESLNITVSLSVLTTATVLVITVLLSFFMLVFGELIPKRIAMKKADTLAYYVVAPINIISKLATPFLKVITVSTDFFIKLMGIDVSGTSDDITEEEIRMMVDASAESGGIAENEIEMINNIFEFDDLLVGDIATHRTEIVALPIDADESEILNLVIDEKYSRIPIYDENIDNIIGILHLKDLMRFLAERSPIDIRALMRKPYYVPFTKKTDELFGEMQRNKIHMSVVIDEYGGTFGLVTMEDLIEEVMGSILDEHDEEEIPDITKLDNNTYSISGSTSLDDVSRFLEIELPTDDYETLSGFIIGQLGRIPSDEEQPEVEFNGLLFKASKIDEKKVLTATVCKL